MLLKLIHKPLQQLAAVWRYDRHSKVQTWFVQWVSNVPPPARHVDHVAILENAIPHRIFLWLPGLFNILFQGMQACWSIHFPVLAPVKLQDDRILTIPVQIETLL